MNLNYTNPIPHVKKDITKASGTSYNVKGNGSTLKPPTIPSYDTIVVYDSNSKTTYDKEVSVLL